MIRYLLLWLMTVGLATGSALAKPRSGATTASRIRATEHALSQFHLENPSENLPYDLPSGVSPLLTQLKHELRGLLLSTINSTSDKSAEHLRADVIGRLRRAGVPVGKANLPPLQSYGGIIDVRFKRPVGHGDLIAATTTLQIPCSAVGSESGDTSLYIFQRKGAGWSLVMAVESNGYAKVDGAQGQFGYAISPSGPHGHWYVVVAEIPVWCTSCRDWLHYKVLRAGPSPDSPVVVLKADKGVYRCAEPPYKPAVGRASFRVTYVAMNSLDFNLFTAFQVDRFAVNGDHAVQTPPLAYTPQDFINAWLQLSWKEAVGWVNPANAASLGKWHGRLQPRVSGEYIESGVVDLVQPCDSPATRWQVGVSDEFARPKRSLFFTVTKKKNAYRLERIDTSRPGGCPGNAPPIEISSWKSLSGQSQR